MALLFKLFQMSTIQIFAIRFCLCYNHFKQKGFKHLSIKNIKTVLGLGVCSLAGRMLAYHTDAGGLALLPIIASMECGVACLDSALSYRVSLNPA